VVAGDGGATASVASIGKFADGADIDGPAAGSSMPARLGWTVGAGGASAVVVGLGMP
jgi:hypothetical protein